MDNNGLTENPYYEGDWDMGNKGNQRTTNGAVNLEDTEVVTATENIYYDL